MHHLPSEARTQEEKKKSIKHTKAKKHEAIKNRKKLRGLKIFTLR